MRLSSRFTTRGRPDRGQGDKVLLLHLISILDSSLRREEISGDSDSDVEPEKRVIELDERLPIEWIEIEEEESSISSTLSC